jgi:hypothetical protein
VVEGSAADDEGVDYVAAAGLVEEASGDEEAAGDEESQ